MLGAGAGLALPVQTVANRENRDFLVAAHAVALEQRGYAVARRLANPADSPTQLAASPGEGLCPRDHARPRVRDERPMKERAPRPTLG